MVDSLRGWAALTVVWYHAFGLGLFSAFPGSKWLAHLQANRSAVTLFFVISGYVMGLRSKIPCTGLALRGYAGRRCTRILPIYLVALGLGFLATSALTGRTALGHFFFLQDFDGDFPLSVFPMEGNQPLWSLHYEVIYYALFAVWWRWPVTIPISLVVSTIAATAGSFSAAFPRFSISHAVGMIFWLAGLLIARLPLSESRPRAGKIWANILWLHAAQHAALPLLLLHALRWTNTASWLGLNEFALLPGCVVLVAIAGGSALPAFRFWQTLAIAVGVVGSLVVIATRHSLTEPRWAVLVASTVVGMLVWRIQSTKSLNLLTEIGLSSYALYAIHTPILIFIARATNADVSPWGAALGLVAGGLVLALLAWWLERRLQPRLAAWLHPRRVEKPA